MSYHIDQLDGDRILVVTYGRDFELAAGLSAVIRDELAILNAASQDMVIISDLRGVSVDLEGLIRAANEVRTGDGQAVIRHPRLLTNLVVTGSRVVELAAKGMNSATFGHVVAPVFPTLEEALAYARQQLDAA